MVSYAWAAMTPGVIVTYFCLIKKWCHQRCHSCVSFSVQLDLQCQAYLLLSSFRLWLESQIFLIAIFLLARRNAWRFTRLMHIIASLSTSSSELGSLSQSCWNMQTSHLKETSKSSPSLASTYRSLLSFQAIHPEANLLSSPSAGVSSCTSSAMKSSSSFFEE